MIADKKELELDWRLIELEVMAYTEEMVAFYSSLLYVTINYNITIYLDLLKRNFKIKCLIEIRI